MTIYDLKNLIKQNKIITNQYYILEDGSIFIGKTRNTVVFIKKESKDSTRTTDNSYKELIFDSNGNLSKIEIYNNNSKQEKIYIKTFKYSDSGNLLSIETKNLKANTTETKILSYDSNGNLSKITIN